MKKKLIVSSIAILLLLTGCLTFDSYRVHIQFNDENYSGGRINITYFGLVSDADSLHKRQDDFNEVLEFYNEDDFLLDEMDSGIYVKERKLFKDKKGLGFSYSGIFKKLNLDGADLQIQKDKIVFELNTDDMVLSKTNGEIFKDSSKVYLSWPRGTKDLYWEIQNNEDDEILYSLVPFYDKWQAKK